MARIRNKKIAPLSPETLLYRALTGGFLFLRIFSDFVSPNVSLILNSILISMFLR